MGRTDCTEPQCLYSTAILLLLILAVQPVQSLSACTRVHFNFSTEFCHSTASQTATVFKNLLPAILCFMLHIVHYVMATSLICCIYYHLHACYTSRPLYFSFHCSWYLKKILYSAEFQHPLIFKFVRNSRTISSANYLQAEEKMTMSLMTVHQIFLWLLFG